MLRCCDLAVVVSTDAEAQFRAFLERAHEVEPRLTTDDHATRFRELLRRARPLAAGPLREKAALLAPFVATATQWATVHDLLTVAGRHYDEDAYTELVAWALHPETHPASALGRQNAWLVALFPSGDHRVSRAIAPTTQVVTDTGVPDLILDFDEFTIVVEAKTGSQEHEAASSGVDQTVAYPEAVRRALALPESKSVEMVFLTPDAREARNPHAVTTSYARFAAVVAQAVMEHELPVDLRGALSIVFVHFWSLPLNGGARVLAALLGRLRNVFPRGKVTDDDSLLLSALGDLKQLESLLQRGGLP